MYKEVLRQLTQKVEIEDKKLIEEMVNDLSSYVKKVSDMENAINLARFRMDGQEYRDYISILDYQRRAAHNAAIVNVKVLNKFCLLYNLEPIYKDDENDRNLVGDFCFTIVQELFSEREKIVA